ncbi:MAG: prolyl oligopeptidase family serine peptidase [Ilumatobacteraceae bacterium]
MTAPATRRQDVVDVLHGVEVPDPYRWLEDGDDPEVAAWVEAQNGHTRSLLDTPAHGWWQRRLTDLLQLPVALAVQVRGDVLLALERPAGAEQFVLTRRSSIHAAQPPVVLVDPAAGITDSASAIDWFEASADGRLVAVGTSEGGTEESVLRLIDTADGGDAGESIPDTRACSVAWDPDGTGFAYTRYPDGDQYHRTVHHHVVGTDWHDDPVVWAEHPNPQAWPDVTASPDGRWLLVQVLVGWARYDVHLLDRSTGQWSTVIEGVDVTSWFDFAVDGASLVGVTTLDAPRGRVVRVPFDAADPAEWRTLVAEGEAVLSPFLLRVLGDELWVVASERAVDEVRRFTPDGAPLGVVAGLGEIIAVVGLAADRNTGRAFAVVDSFGTPTAVFNASGTTAERWFPDPSTSEPPAGGVIPSMIVSQLEYPSLDGTAIGVYIIHRDDVVPGPDTPAILNGYGGFALAETPVWSPQIAAWCAAGGVFAIAGLRGGLEHGEAWHHAGRRGTKQNVFDDFHACADWLVSTDRVDRQRLAILGRSNGGLLVGAALTQRPELCRAVWCGVPLLDMVRFPQFLIAKLWTDEYGDPDVAEEFAWLHAYSPYHRVVDGTCYPATLFTTAEGDTRVDPLHARKMAALLQATSTCQDERPTLLYQEGRAGHGVGKPVGKRAAELADGLVFLAEQLRLAAEHRS